MSQFKLDRRGLLKGLAACFLLSAVIPQEAVEAPEVAPEVWRALELNPVTFTVNVDGRIGNSGYPSPQNRAEAFDLSYKDVATPEGLLDTAESVQPLMWHLYNQYQE